MKTKTPTNTKTPMRTSTLLLTLAVALAGAGACGEPPSQQETTDENLPTPAGETNETSQEGAAATDEGETLLAAPAAPSCIAMRNGSIKRTKLPGQWTGIIDNACNSSMSINLDIGCGNKDPGCRTYSAKTSYYVKWWAGLGTSCFRKVYECS